MADRKKAKITDIEVRGRKIPVYAVISTYAGSEPTGRFYAEIDDHSYSEDDFESLRKKLVEHTRKAAAKLNVRLCLLDNKRSRRMGLKGINPVHVTVYGVHGGNGDLLARDDEGEAYRFGWYEHLVSLPLTEPEISEYVDLVQAEAEASKRRADWEKTNAMDSDDLKKMIHQELEKLGQS
jgi:hypothetical protein